MEEAITEKKKKKRKKSQQVVVLGSKIKVIRQRWRCQTHAAAGLQDCDCDRCDLLAEHELSTCNRVTDGSGPEGTQQPDLLMIHSEGSVTPNSSIALFPSHRLPMPDSHPHPSTFHWRLYAVVRRVLGPNLITHSLFNCSLEPNLGFLSIEFKFLCSVLWNSHNVDLFVEESSVL
ncbi:hypothetical protein JOB18_003803 [Solea senegalensis]|uniref:Uncharacterized protein n=1 Tax=Solea senegalensis TaxID=28829 RepID=A0AAV6QM29_SOLSE|nr:hypothetical protein JOB18_003803 [Solea senegalensis]